MSQRACVPELLPPKHGLCCFRQKYVGTPMSPEERIAAVKPYWQQLTQEQRAYALTVDFATLRQQAEQLTERARAKAGEQQPWLWFADLEKLAYCTDHALANWVHVHANWVHVPQSSSDFSEWNGELHLWVSLQKEHKNHCSNWSSLRACWQASHAL